MPQKIIGILGGMGPAATVDIFNKFVRLMPAQCDQEHIPLLICSIPDIPDRTQAVLNGGPSPLFHLLRYLSILENGGAKCIIIPCNTAHLWFDDLKQATDKPMISIIDSAINEVLARDNKKVAILATNATVASDLYQNKLEQHNVDAILPTPQEQKKVMESIYDFKAGNLTHASTTLSHIADRLLGQGADSIILGCTEIPLILEKQIEHHPDNFIDATTTLVHASINWYQKNSNS